jgi:Ser/Thr protein kinase RdoA (MazF antagonist)
VLWDSNNTVVHLDPMPIVAKVARGGRGESAAALGRELAVGAHAARMGAPVAEPSPELPCEVHWHDGQALTFWRYYEHDPGVRVECAVAAAALDEVHRALSSFVGPLPRWRPDVPDLRAVLLKGHSRRLRERDRDFLIAEHERLSGELAGEELRRQPIHGSPHGYNRLCVDGRIVWIDLESACVGPLEWDAVHVGCPEAFGAADRRVLGLLDDLMRLKTAVACWARMDEAPDLAWHAAHHLGVLRSRSLGRKTS